MLTLPRTTKLWIALVVASLAAFLFGIFSYAQEFDHATIATNLRTPGHGGVAWGLYVVFVIFFTGLSFAGTTTLAFCRLLRVDALKPIARIAELITIIALLCGATCVLADLGRPIHGLTKLPRYANAASPFFGTFTVAMASYFFANLVYFFLAGRADAASMADAPTTRGRFLYRLWASGYHDLPEQRRRHHRATFFLALAIIVLLVVARSTLGFVVATQSGRPGWYSALMAPSFLIIDGVSATGLLIVAGVALRRLFKLHDHLPDTLFRWLGNFLWVLTLINLYFIVVEEITATYAAPRADRDLAIAVVQGPFAAPFWTMVSAFGLTFLFPFIQYMRRRTSIAWLVAAGFLANIGVILRRFLTVVPSQSHGALTPITEPHFYIPSWSEVGVIAGLFGLIALVVLLFGRTFPLIPTPRPYVRPAAPQRPNLVHRAIVFLVATIGLALVVLGLSDSLRLFDRDAVDPRIPFSPIIFAVGVMVLFGSAVVYELLAPRSDKLASSGAPVSDSADSINPLTKRGETC
ncbi:MAG: polysulfide reductase NrfD [Deltaproteobacteria bacterium]|nr:polysulfide reductase NrfD [Deltaproteobacteria bacterium]